MLQVPLANKLAPAAKEFAHQHSLANSAPANEYPLASQPPTQNSADMSVAFVKP
jgi:hypothetical protein